MSWLPELVLLGLLAVQAAGGEERRSGTEVMRAVLSGGPGEPGFWPSRGRRGGEGGSPDDPAPPFWAHRGREGDPQVSGPCGPLPELPKYVMAGRREDYWPGRARKRADN